MENFNIAYDPDTVKNFNTALDRYVKELNMDTNKVIKQWSGNLAENLMMETPPFTTGRSASNGLDARKHGIDVLRDNIRKAVKPADEFFGKPIKDKRLKKLILANDRAKVENFMHYSGYGSDWKVEPFTETLHKLHRPPSRYSKIRGRKVITLDKAKYKDYVAKMEGLVGWMKSGWAVSMQALGKKVPVWIAKNLGIAPGKFTENKDQSTVSYTIENHAPTISRYGGRFNYAIAWMFKKMEKDIAIRLDYLAKKKNGKL